jgi:hypothetical protein
MHPIEIEVSDCTLDVQFASQGYSKTVVCLVESLQQHQTIQQDTTLIRSHQQF